MKQIMIAVVAVVMVMIHTQANAQGLSGLMATVEESMPVLERLAAADEDDLALHCAGNQECIDGMRNDVKHLNKALDILKRQSASYQANKAAFDAQESSIRGGR